MSNGSSFRSRIYVRKKKTVLSQGQRSAAFLWQQDSSLFGETRVLPSGLRVQSLRVPMSRLAGRSILFFSDTHFRTYGVRGFFPRVKQGGGTEWLTKAFRELFETIPMPSCIAFGGDLAGEAAWLGPAFDFLRTLPSAPPKFAVCGNWELRRRWISVERWRALFADAGFRLLINEYAEAEGILFCGLDDAKEGDGLFSEAKIPLSRNVCVLSHSPDTAAAMLTPDKLEGGPLILCGHTHGGQYRIPGYGAILTSSRFGKRLEYGPYRHTSADSVLYVTAGIGATWFHSRICCPPEVLLVNFC